MNNSGWFKEMLPEIINVIIENVKCDHKTSWKLNNMHGSEITQEYEHT